MRFKNLEEALKLRNIESARSSAAQKNRARSKRGAGVPPARIIKRADPHANLFFKRIKIPPRPRGSINFRSEIAVSAQRRAERQMDVQRVRECLCGDQVERPFSVTFEQRYTRDDNSFCMRFEDRFGKIEMCLRLDNSLRLAGFYCEIMEHRSLRQVLLFRHAADDVDAVGSV